jgi:hypothetical protein
MAGSPSWRPQLSMVCPLAIPGFDFPGFDGHTKPFVSLATEVFSLVTRKPFNGGWQALDARLRGQAPRRITGIKLVARY